MFDHRLTDSSTQAEFGHNYVKPIGWARNGMVVYKNHICRFHVRVVILEGFL